MTLIKKNHKFEENYLSGPIPILGLLANFGLASISYLIILEINRWAEMSTLWNLNIFSIIYLTFYLISLKYIVKKDNKLRFGFILSFILIGLSVLIRYIKLFI